MKTFRTPRLSNLAAELIVAAGLTFVAFTCKADVLPDTVGVHLGSIHSNNFDPVAQRPWNNVNPGLYAKWGNVVLGTYYNSIRKQSVYAGYAYPLLENLDIVVGVISGYDGPGYRAKPVMPMLIPSAHFHVYGNMSARVNLAIGVGKGSATAVNFALEWKL